MALPVRRRGRVFVPALSLCAACAGSAPPAAATPRASVTPTHDAGAPDAGPLAVPAPVAPDAIEASPRERGPGLCPSTCTGTATPAFFGETQTSTARAKLCYDQALSTQPSLNGSMHVRFRIAGDGAVCWAELAQSDMPPTMNKCVVDVFATSGPFPAVVGDCVNVTMPLRFKPTSKPGASGDAAP